MTRLLSLFLLLSLTATAQKNQLSLLEKYVQSKADVNQFSGAVLVAQQGKVIYQKAFGLANRELNVPNTLQTKFEIGSLTKQFTSAAILQLAEAGKLSLDDKLSKFFPAFPKGDSVTIHMLLTHTSGIMSYTNMMKFSSLMTLPYPKDSVVALVQAAPYDFSPGSRFNYSNSGYFLLGYIIEKVSGQSYSNYLLENVFKKAGLENTSVNRLDSVLLNRAAGYYPTPGGWKNAPFISMEFPYSAGAIISTVEDLYKWNQALFGNKIISPAMLTRMTTPYLNKYGYGLIIDTLYNQSFINHSGGIPGFLSFNAYFPSDNIQVVVLSNNSFSSPVIANTIAAILFGKEVIPAYEHKEVKIDGKNLDKLVGKYQGPANILELLTRDGKLYRRATGSPDVELKPESDHTFFYADNSDRQLDFILNNDKSVRKARFISGSVVFDLTRIQ